MRLAKCFIQSERGVFTYNKLKICVLEKFLRTVTSAELHRMLQKRVMKRDKSYQQYVPAIKEIAVRGGIEDEALILYKSIL